MTIKQAAVWAILGTVALVPAVTYAQDRNDPAHPTEASFALGTDESGFDSTVTNFRGTASTTDFSLIGAIRVVVNAFLALVSLIAVIVIIFAGFRYITSGGDEEATATAKNQIIFALIGLVIILLSAIIVNFVISLFPTAGS